MLISPVDPGYNCKGFASLFNIIFQQPQRHDPHGALLRPLLLCYVLPEFDYGWLCLTLFDFLLCAWFSLLEDNFL
jgi:hypothetical protein